MRERFIVPIILILGLALYFPAVQTGTFILDDGDVIAQAKRLTDRSFLELFIRGGGSTYYRPVLMLSYLADIKLWDAHPGLMHLVNILLHVLNAILVYLIVRIFHPLKKSTVRTLPLIAATLFLVHPINTESINWISGRSDPLAAFFALIATYLVLLSMQDRKKDRLWLASIFLILGSMSKEVAFFCFPAITLFLLLYKVKRPLLSPCLTWSWRLTAIVPFVFGGAAYFFMRTASFKHVDKGISKVTDTQSYSLPFTMVKQLITDFGFYIKKLIVPQPLSLAIDQVHPNYFWLGIAAIVVLLIVLSFRNFQAGMALLMALTIFPALLNALFHIAWTPYAERYLYLSSAFMCIALALPPLSINKKASQNCQTTILIILVCVFLPTTINRNLLWAKPLELTRLTHQQNPGNPTMWSMYAVMLANQEFYDEARNEFQKVLKEHPKHLYAYESLAAMEMYIEDPVAARKSLESFYYGELTPNRKILQIMLESNQKRLQMSGNAAEHQSIRSELIETQLMLYASDKRYEHLLDVARLHISNNDHKAAKINLKTLLESEGVSANITQKATVLLTTLE